MEHKRGDRRLENDWLSGSMCRRGTKTTWRWCIQTRANLNLHTAKVWIYNHSGGSLESWPLPAEVPTAIRFNTPAVVKQFVSKSWTSLNRDVLILISLIKQEYSYIIGTNFNDCIHTSRQPNWTQLNRETGRPSALKGQKMFLLLCLLAQRSHDGTCDVFCFALACLLNAIWKETNLRRQKVNTFPRLGQSVGFKRIKPLSEWLISSSWLWKGFH